MQLHREDDFLAAPGYDSRSVSNRTRCALLEGELGTADGRRVSGKCRPRYLTSGLGRRWKLPDPAWGSGATGGNRRRRARLLLPARFYPCAAADVPAGIHPRAIVRREHGILRSRVFVTRFDPVVGDHYLAKEPNSTRRTAAAGSRSRAGFFRFSLPERSREMAGTGGSGGFLSSSPPGGFRVESRGLSVRALRWR